MTEEVMSEIKAEIMDIVEYYGHSHLAIIATHKVLIDFAEAEYETFKK